MLAVISSADLSDPHQVKSVVVLLESVLFRARRLALELGVSAADLP